MRRKLLLVAILVVVMIPFSACQKDSNTNLGAASVENDPYHTSIGTGETQKETDYLTKALELLQLLETQDGENEFLTKQSFGELHADAQNVLGINNRLTRILGHIYKYGMSADSAMIIEMAKNIFMYDDGKLPVSFISETCYLFNDNRYEYDNIYPVYDLSTGQFGLYDLSIRQYIYEPTLTYMSEPDECGYICVCYKGYYGCIDMEGNKTIGFYYEAPLHFINGVSVVKSNGKYGLIDKDGIEVISTMFDDVKIAGDYIQVGSNSESTALGLYDYDGNLVIDTKYMNFIYMDGIILAEQPGYSWGSAVSTGKYDLYDCYGNKFSPRTITQLSGYECDEISYVSVVGSGVLAINCTISYSSGDTEYILLFDLQLNLLSNQCYSSVGAFSSLGYATAMTSKIYIDENQYRGDRYRTRDVGWAVINSAGETVCNLPPVDLEVAGNYYSSANEYYAYAWGYSGTGIYNYSYAIVNLKTQSVIEYESVEMIDGTNCIIVSDLNTGLYGLYDGEALALDLIYNDINYTTGQIIAVRGAEEIVYTPQY